ncbi:MAG: EamA-like protein transporter family protein [Parcubacteria group bacterium GW2011_GWA2_44_12]|nr:MAG: EamA-like protein transporter family protein [Parcubacteria group bacterium GW2011_GWA2_44_12]
MKNFSKPVLFLFLILAIVSWGGSWPAGKILSQMAAPEVLTFWRFLFVSISFAPIVFLSRQNMRVASMRAFVYILVAAIAFVLYFFFFFLALRQGSAGLGSVIVNGLNPIFTFLAMMILFKKTIAMRALYGLALGLAGGLVLFEVWKLNGTLLTASGNAYFLACALFLSIMTIAASKAHEYISPIVFDFYVFSAVAIVAFFLALPHGIGTPLAFGAPFWYGILYMSLVATTFGVGVYFFASRMLGAARASSFTFLAPVSAVFASWIFLSETPALSTLIGGGMAVFGVYLINKE